MLDSNGAHLSAELRLPEGGGRPRYPAVIVCHGLASCKESHASFAEFLAGQGFAALTFDWRGHGASEGALDGDTLDDVGAALSYLYTRREVDASRIAIRGSSMGSYLALLAAIRYPALRAVVAICPASSEILAQVIGNKEFWLSMDRAAGLRVRVTLPGFQHFLALHDESKAVTGLAPRPLLLIHGQRDEHVPYQHSETLYALAGEPKRLWLLPEATHRDAQHDPVVHAETVHWLRQALPET
ncbi:MAG: alpha/beta fold hydrolase [Anaerolineae bacterium]|nr:alpha/beta fold hydrolase [Anaerolineae bacterium]